MYLGAGAQVVVTFGRDRTGMDAGDVEEGIEGLEDGSAVVVMVAFFRPPDTGKCELKTCWVRRGWRVR